MREIHVQAARADIGVLEILEFRVRRRVHEALDGAAVEPGVHGVRERGIVSADAPDAHHAVPGQVERVRLARVLVGEEERVAHLQTSVARHRQVHAGRIVHPAEAKVAPHAHHARAVDHDGRAVGVRERHHRIRERRRAAAGVRPGVDEKIRRGGLVVGLVAMPHAERRVGQLAAVLRDGGMQDEVGAVRVTPAIVAKVEDGVDVEHAVVHHELARRLDALPDAVRLRAHAEVARRDHGRRVRRVADGSDHDLALVHVEEAEARSRTDTRRSHPVDVAVVLRVVRQHNLAGARQVQRARSHLRETSLDRVHRPDGQRRVRLGDAEDARPAGLGVDRQAGDFRGRARVDERPESQHEIRLGLHKRKVRDARGAAPGCQRAARGETRERSQLDRPVIRVGRIGDDGLGRRHVGSRRRIRRRRIGRHDEHVADRRRRTRRRHRHLQERAVALHVHEARVVHAVWLEREREFLRHLLEVARVLGARRNVRVGAGGREAVRTALLFEQVELRRGDGRADMRLACHVQAAARPEAEDGRIGGRVVAEGERPDRLHAVRDDESAVVAGDRERRAGGQLALLAEVHAREGDLRRPAVRVRRVDPQGRHCARTLRDVEAAVRPAVVQRLDPLLPDDGMCLRAVVEKGVETARPHLDARHRRGEVRRRVVVVAMTPHAAVHDEVQLALRRIDEVAHLHGAAVRDAERRHHAVLLVVVVEVLEAHPGPAARHLHKVRRRDRVRLRRVVAHIDVSVNRAEVAPVVHAHRRVRTRRMGEVQPLADKVVRRRRILDMRVRDVDHRRITLPREIGHVLVHAHVDGVRASALAHEEPPARHAQGRRERRGGIGRRTVAEADRQGTGRAGDAAAVLEDARRLRAVERRARTDRHEARRPRRRQHVRDRAGEGRVVARRRVDHDRAVRHGEVAVPLRRRAVGREVHQLAACAARHRRRAAEVEVRRESERAGTGLHERADGLRHVAVHREVVVDLPHDGGGRRARGVRDRARPHAVRRAGVAERAALLHERTRAQLARRLVRADGLRQHERARAERGAARVGAVGAQVHGAARRARVDREGIFARYERKSVRHSTRRRIDRDHRGHGREGRACRGHNYPCGHYSSFHFKLPFW